MSLPNPAVLWPPRSPLRDEQYRGMLWYSGLNPVLAPNQLTDATLYTYTSRYAPQSSPTPDPGGILPNSQLQTKQVNSNTVGDLASCAADLLMGTPPSLEVNPESDLNHLDNEDATENAQAALSALMETAGVWGTLRTAAELASVTGEAYVRLIADPAMLETPILQAVPSTFADATWRYGRLVSVRLWTIISNEGGNVLRWVEERSNSERVIRNGLYMGSTASLGERVPLDSHPATSGLPEEQAYPDGVTAMVWHLPNARPSRFAPDSPHGRSDFEGSGSLLAALDAAYTGLTRDLRLGQARLIVPTASLTRGMNGGGVWENAREIFTDLDLDPSNPASKPELLQASLRIQEHTDAATALLTRIVAAAGYSPNTFGLGVDGQAESGTALRIRQARTIQTITARRALWSPQISSIAMNIAMTASTVYGTDIEPVIPAVIWPSLVQPDPETTARQILTLTTAGAISPETAVRMAQPDLNDHEVAEEVERIARAKGTQFTMDEYLNIGE